MIRNQADVDYLDEPRQPARRRYQADNAPYPEPEFEITEPPFGDVCTCSMPHDDPVLTCDENRHRDTLQRELDLRDRPRWSGPRQRW